MRCECCGHINEIGGIGREIALVVASLPENHKILIVDDEIGLPPFPENYFLNIIPGGFDMPFIGKREKTWEQPRRKNNYKLRRRK